MKDDLKENELSLPKAAELYSIDRTTLYRWCVTGALKRARQVSKKSKTVWVVDATELDERQTSQSKSSVRFDALVSQWETEQASGYHSNRLISPRRITENTYGLRVFWRYLQNLPAIDNVKLSNLNIESFTAENLKKALANVPVDYANKKDRHASKETMYFAVTSFTQFLVRQGLKPKLTLVEMREVKPKQVFQPRKTVLQENQLESIIAANELWTNGRSAFDKQLTKTLIYLFAYAGLRRSEAVNLELSHVDLPNRMLHVVDGKGHKHRTVGICSELMSQLESWMTFYRQEHDGKRFLIQASGRPITREVVNHRIQRLSAKAGIDITPHGMRRTFATLMENRGMPWSLMQLSLGHADIKTTKRYVMSEEKQAVDWLKNYGQKAIETSTDPEKTPEAILQAVLQALN
jgi:integrase